MKTALCVFVAIGAVFFFFDTGFAIKCFVCNSFHQADCADWFDNVTQHLVNCPNGASKCRKVVQEVWLEDHWDVRYIRQCAQDGDIGMYEGRICQERYGSYNVRMRYCHCNNQDGCNSASSLIPVRGLGQFMPFAVAFLAAFVRHLFVGR